jgi:transposase-like protein
MLKKCPKCSSEGIWSAGFAIVNGSKKKRWKCKTCDYQFTKDTPQEYPEELKLKAIKMLREGIGFRGIGRLLGISFETVRRWSKSFASRTFNFNINDIEEQEVQIDEMCIQIKKSLPKEAQGLLIMPSQNKCLTLKLEAEKQELLINYLQELKEGSKSQDITPITFQFIKN